MVNSNHCVWFIVMIILVNNNEGSVFLSNNITMGLSNPNLYIGTFYYFLCILKVVTVSVVVAILNIKLLSSIDPTEQIYNQHSYNFPHCFVYELCLRCRYEQVPRIKSSDNACFS